MRGTRKREREGTRASSLVLKGQYLTRRRRPRARARMSGRMSRVMTEKNRVCAGAAVISRTRRARGDTRFSPKHRRGYFSADSHTPRGRSLARSLDCGGQKNIRRKSRRKNRRRLLFRRALEERTRGITGLRAAARPRRTRRILGGQKRNCSSSRSRANLFDMPGKPDCECDFPRKADYGLSSFPA